MSAPTPPWTGAEVCAQTDPELFFPEKGGTTAPAKALCMTCPTRVPCLEYALATEPSDLAHGVWGGTSANDRQAGSERGVSAPVPAAGYVATVDPREADELREVLELARQRRDDVERDLAELRTSPERADRVGRLLQRVTQETLATELQLWRREVTNLETAAMLLGLRTLGIPAA